MEDEDGFVYCLVDDKSKPTLIKIGHTKDVAKRVRQINTGMPITMHLWWSHPGTRDDEQAMHYCMRKFKHTEGRQREWYTASDLSINRSHFHSAGPMSGYYIERMKWIKQVRIYDYLKRRKQNWPSQLWINSYILRPESTFHFLLSELISDSMKLCDRTTGTICTSYIAGLERIVKNVNTYRLTDHDIQFVMDASLALANYALSHDMYDDICKHCLHDRLGVKAEMFKSKYRLRYNYV